jgi:hypothetical protein
MINKLLLFNLSCTSYNYIFQLYVHVIKGIWEYILGQV